MHYTTMILALSSIGSLCAAAPIFDEQTRNMPLPLRIAGIHQSAEPGSLPWNSPKSLDCPEEADDEQEGKGEIETDWR
ncbi:uncharacterized protein LAESUDRAFT_815989 [Laetiporus sulphureus 93-53]|uniref:Uncharacterized protein n=1 Tax=Laetiporus sulphureus 93-53 TaxID=1314785 RepID=A0A165BM26_9APHY|nr:uncharacterized protein LAESUDRAFT_815989 [Laetiporus sulphureus 93-53]KZT01294.1 hypothetical protein LAESUDRAFT_815989 [Laetiporus sulphureus 93-53]